MKSLLEYIKSQPEHIVRGWFSDHDCPAQLSYSFMVDTVNYGLMAFQNAPIEVQTAIITNYSNVYLRPLTPIQ